MEFEVTPGADDATGADPDGFDGPGEFEFEQAAVTSPTASAVVATTRLPRRCLTLFPLFLPGLFVAPNASIPSDQATRLTPMSVLVPVTVVLPRPVRRGR